jgi:hypothetical protein
MASKISRELIEQIRNRLADDWRRTGEGDWQRTPRDRRPIQPDLGLGGMLLSAFVNNLPGPDPQPLKPIETLDDKEIAKVETRLGFRLPDDYRELVKQVGDGNFGPFLGIRRLGNWAKDYLKLRAELKEERGHEWPENLLPMVFLNGRRICLDRDSGAVVLWDRPPKRCSLKKWEASFVPQSASLEEWLKRWVDTPAASEGGPPGGWTPPEAEIERRDARERAAEERQKAAIERAHRFTVVDMPELEAGLLDRLSKRAGDPDRRTALAGLVRTATPFDPAGTAREAIEHPDIPIETKEHIGALSEKVGLLSRMMGGLGLSMVGGTGGGMMMVGRGAGGALGAPTPENSIEAAGHVLGFAVPVPVRQLYSLADGGFGPGDEGLWPLEQVLRTYRKYNSSPQGPNDEPWPPRYMPIAASDPGLYCLDLASGAIILHDVQEMDHLGRGQWERSFRKQSPDLASWLREWLDEPTMAEQVRTIEAEIEAKHRQNRASPVTGWPMQFSDPSEQAEAEITFLSYADPSLRADYGLPEIAWEDEVRQRHGVDLEPAKSSG